MPRKVLEEFSVEYLQVLDEKGKADAKLMPKLSKEELLKMYELMVVTRTLDDKMFKLQRQGRLGTYAQSIGEEATPVGVAMALHKEDWVFPAFRQHGLFIQRGYPMSMYIQYWGGDERGNKTPDDINIFPVAVPVASQIPHAVGCAWALKMKGKKAAAVTFFGDGGTSRGDFHEGMNFAGVFQAPCVFVCQNNQWAISVPVSKQTHAKTIAQKAVAYGMPGIRVDGNDVLAVYTAVKEAVDNARQGKGPSLVECLTYRMGDHTTSDDAKKYRPEADVEAWKAKDPITRMEKYLTEKKLLAPGDKERIWAEAAAKVDAAVKEYESMPKPAPTDMFNYTFAKHTPEIEEQMNELKDELMDKEEEHDSSSDDKDVVAAH